MSVSLKATPEVPSPAFLPVTATVEQPSSTCSDAALLELFEHRPRQAWELFIDRYSDLICACLRRLGFDYDQVMDRFVYICGKLREQDYRRLRNVKYLGNSGELTPWLVQVIRNLVINWAQSRHGRKRLFKVITRLETLDQRIFQAYFWSGLTPSEICEALRAEDNATVELIEVLDSLERIMGELNANHRWRLLSQLTRRREPVPLTSEDGDGAPEQWIPSPQASPEEELLRTERREQMRAALVGLEPRSRRLLELRYEEGLSVSQAARLLQVSDREARSTLRSARRILRLRLSKS